MATTAAIVLAKSCPTCSGTCLTVDDGSVTGKPGEPLPCSCSTPANKKRHTPDGAHYSVRLKLSLDESECACAGTGWLDGGFYDWEGETYLAADERCPVHPV